MHITLSYLRRSQKSIRILKTYLDVVQFEHSIVVATDDYESIETRRFVDDDRARGPRLDRPFDHPVACRILCRHQILLYEFLFLFVCCDIFVAFITIECILLDPVPIVVVKVRIPDCVFTVEIDSTHIVFAFDVFAKFNQIVGNQIFSAATSSAIASTTATVRRWTMILVVRTTALPIAIIVGRHWCIVFYVCWPWNNITVLGFRLFNIGIIVIDCGGCLSSIVSC